MKFEPQLLNEVGVASLEYLIDSADWCAQEKMDGDRMIVEMAGGVVTAFSRTGNVVALPACLVGALMLISGSWVADGELVDGRFFAFDLISSDGQSLASFTFKYRFNKLCQIFNSGDLVSVVPVAWNADDKRGLFNLVKSSGGEGAVFKRVQSQYRSGRPNSGGDQLKFKFVISGSFIVVAKNKQRSVSVSLADGTSVGNVAIPASRSIPDIGQIVEVRYLYVFKKSMALFQPVYLGSRRDISKKNCTSKQLKFKP